jgi:hypothetical protein
MFLQSDFILSALYVNFSCYTPGSAYVTPDGTGQFLLPLTPRPATCASTFGGLPNGLGILLPSAACANIFLTRVNRKSQCESCFPLLEER